MLNLPESKVLMDLWTAIGLAFLFLWALIKPIAMDLTLATLVVAIVFLVIGVATSGILNKR